MKVIVLVNSAAGSAREGLDRPQLQEMFSGAGVEADIRLLSGEELTTAARQAAGEAVGAVVAAGGDGTIRTVAGALVGGNVPLAILPCGTLNHFAKALGIPLNLPDAVRTIAARHVRRVDVAEVNGHVFVNNSSIGFYPAIVKDREQQQSELGRGKWPAMLQAGLRVFRRFPLLDVLLQAEGQELRRRTPFVFVGNNHYELNLLALGQRPHLDRGELGVHVANCSSRAALLALVGRALLGRLIQAADFESFLLAELQVATRRHHLSVSVDGEVLRLVPPLQYRSRPGVLAVLVPPVA